MDTNNALEQLKNIHLPPEVSLFPLAIGWYSLIIVIMIVCGLSIWWKLKYNKRQRYLQSIYKLLADIETSNQDDTITQTSTLVKRVAVTQFPDQHPHTLFGEKWLIFLDKTGKTTQFTQGPGRDLLNIYQKQKISDPEKFFAVIRLWLGTVL